MQFLKDQQKRILDDFVTQTSSLIEMGFAYSAVHESYLKILNCHDEKIKMIKSNQRANPRISDCYDRMLQHEYIHYIVNLFRAGLKYAKNNPKYLDKVDQVQRVLNDYGRLIRNSNVQSPSATYFRKGNERDSVNQEASKMFPVNKTFRNQKSVKDQSYPVKQSMNPANQSPNPVNQYPKSVNQYPKSGNQYPKSVNQYPNSVNQYPNPIRQHPNHVTSHHPYPIRPTTVPARRSPSTDDNNAFEQIYEHINHLSTEIDEIRNGTYNLEKMHSTPQSSRSSSDCIKQLNDEISRKLSELQRRKKNRMRQREKARKFEQTMHKKDLNTLFNPVIRNEDGDIEDSFFKYPSEVLVNNETFVKPQPQPPKVGRIERNIVIPIQVGENQKYPKINPHAYFEKASDGSMRINVCLEFDEKVLCDDKLINQIQVRNLLTM